MDKEHQASHDISYIRQIVMNPVTFNRHYSVPFSPRLIHPPIQPGLPGILSLLLSTFLSKLRIISFLQISAFYCTYHVKGRLLHAMLSFHIFLRKPHLMQSAPINRITTKFIIQSHSWVFTVCLFILFHGSPLSKFL